jgi:hypothetical protein
MAVTVQLKDIVDALEMQLDESSSYLDLDSGKVEAVSHDLLSAAEESDEEPDLPDWQKPEWEIARRIVSTDRFKSLPTKYDVHEWEIMRDFANSVESEKVSEELLNAIHGAGAFRYFKDTLRRRGVETKWFEFREDALKQIAREWCEEEGIAWE